ncbi:hypothetical protein NUACC26_010440 [Scytonema sp. NUACC26]
MFVYFSQLICGWVKFKYCFDNSTNPFVFHTSSFRWLAMYGEILRKLNAKLNDKTDVYCVKVTSCCERKAEGRGQKAEGKIVKFNIKISFLCHRLLWSKAPTFKYGEKMRSKFIKYLIFMPRDSFCPLPSYFCLFKCSEEED